ncbi:3-methyl-2-oxobutanoate hydroxymethyltransferase [Halobellus sp. GM3]|uniref:3-methyl-2-oxobutanoate hydroxymethyltransferase n=1 Tax=Halobellus sp. GM3 TaxID=3458410 RepID=UPI00403DB096
MTTVRDIRERSEDGAKPVTVLTAYDATMASILEAAGVDVVLVGDSAGNTALGYDSTLPVTYEEIKSRSAAVARAIDDALVVADMPFLSVGVDEAESVRNCGRLLKEAGVDAVKLESGEHTVGLTERLVELGVPVMAHVGLTPQRVKELGYQKQGTAEAEAEDIVELARRHEAAGAFSIVLEHVPASLAERITAELDIPTIGIGAGPDCDGQVLVIDDVLGLSERSPPFARRFASIRDEIEGAAEAYCAAVEDGSFPAPPDDAE